MTQTASSIDLDGGGLRESMSMAIEHSLSERPIDLVIAHAPGTRGGDRAEAKALQAVFPEKGPGITSNKWKVGHLLGASGAISVNQAVHILRGASVPEFPLPDFVLATARLDQEDPHQCDWLRRQRHQRDRLRPSLFLD